MSREMAGVIVLSALLPVILLALPVASVSVGGTEKAVALLFPAGVSAFTAFLLWWLSSAFRRNR